MAGPPELAGVEIAARGKKIYREKIRPLMTESDIGKYVIVDVYSGDCEIDEWRVEADLKLRARAPDACGYISETAGADCDTGQHRQSARFACDS